ncbi:MAG: hypothetical protein HP494_08650 [Nitrospira sp.]|nr:hypothetical protein [Nitrospira sp.]
MKIDEYVPEMMPHTMTVLKNFKSGVAEPMKISKSSDAAMWRPILTATLLSMNGPTCDNP